MQVCLLVDGQMVCWESLLLMCLAYVFRRLIRFYIVCSTGIQAATFWCLLQTPKLQMTSLCASEMWSLSSGLTSWLQVSKLGKHDNWDAMAESTLLTVSATCEGFVFCSPSSEKKRSSDFTLKSPSQHCAFAWRLPLFCREWAACSDHPVWRISRSPGGCYSVFQPRPGLSPANAGGLYEQTEQLHKSCATAAILSMTITTRYSCCWHGVYRMMSQLKWSIFHWGVMDSIMRRVANLNRIEVSETLHVFCFIGIKMKKKWFRWWRLRGWWRCPSEAAFEGWLHHSHKTWLSHFEGSSKYAKQMCPFIPEQQSL